eukprot:CAMPEP_0174703264 /NCGR_PEP_ID=MMETSP1094-20130205/7272_1 /TAXON_ID=156173 /ORGANISM="Chrysochromulina brevifilum, Strain UTEX LB 985" /LENGTH=474 /DNA_ID=CAMNT_0015901157 /DNA_START=168 /DNA_END=1588 /DNA_ORIENTATION=-
MAWCLGTVREGAVVKVMVLIALGEIAPLAAAADQISPQLVSKSIAYTGISTAHVTRQLAGKSTGISTAKWDEICPGTWAGCGQVNRVCCLLPGDGNLQEAVDEIEDFTKSWVLELDDGDYTYTNKDVLEIKDSKQRDLIITIRARNRRQAKLDGQLADGKHVVYIKRIKEIHLEGLVITKGNANSGGTGTNTRGGGLYIDLGFASSYTSVTINDCSISDNIATYQGAGLYVNGKNVDITHVTVIDSEILDNIMPTQYSGTTSNYQYGGGVYMYYGLLALTNCIIRGNQAKQGGGLCVKVHRRATWVILDGCQIEGNWATSLAGGAYFYLSNRAYMTPGHFLSDAGVSAFICNSCTFKDNTAGDKGGALRIYYAPKSGGFPELKAAVRLNLCSFSGNQEEKAGETSDDISVTKANMLNGGSLSYVYLCKTVPPPATLMSPKVTVDDAQALTEDDDACEWPSPPPSPLAPPPADPP